MSALNSFSSQPAELSGEPAPGSTGQSATEKLVQDERWQLAQRVVASKSFAKSLFLTKFLLYVCEKELTGRSQEICEQQVGVHVFGRRPDYSPGEDNIVRNYARQLRHRLDLYFEEDGQHEKLRITIPRGRYVPVFSSNHDSGWSVDELAASETPDTGHISHHHELHAVLPAHVDVLTSRKRRYRILYLILLLILIGGALVWTASDRLIHRNDTSSHILWAQLFNNSHLTYIVPADDGIVMFQNLTKHLVPLADYIDRAYLSVKPDSAVDDKNMADLEAQRYTSVTDLNAVLRLSELPERRADHTIVSYAREFHMQDLKDSNAVLIGSRFSNPWVEIFEKNLNFQFNYEATPNASFIRNMHPQSGELTVYENGAADPSHQTYGVIALTHNLNSTGWVLIVEGLTMAGTQAAVDTLFDPHAMQPILDNAKNKDGSFRPFEILIETRSFGSNSPQASIIATRYYSK